MENGANIDTIISELNEGPVGPITFEQLGKLDKAAAGLRPRWNSEEPRDYSIVNSQPDIDAAFVKVTANRVDPDAATAAITADVLRRLSSGGDDHFRATNDIEDEEADEDDEAAEVLGATPFDRHVERMKAMIEFRVAQGGSRADVVSQLRQVTTSDYSQRVISAAAA